LGIEVATSGTADAADWDAFVDAHPEGTLFHRWAWGGLLERSVGFSPRYLIARSAGAVVGVLPMVQVRSMLFGTALVSLPFCVRAGVLAVSDVVAARLLGKAREMVRSLGIGYLELRHIRRIAADTLCKDHLYVNFSRALEPTVDENMKKIPRKQRAVVRKGIEAGLTSREEHGIEPFFTIYATSVRNLGTPVFPRRFFAALLETFRDHSRITTVYNGDKPVASVLSFLYKGAVMPYYGGGLPVARNLKAYDFMYWEVMRTACEAGFAVFDYGRSKVDTGSYAFKKNWGFEPVPLAYEYLLGTIREMPDRNPNNPRYAFAVNSWKKLPLPVANVLGPLVSPYLA
jgi:FemAB-related protein (PEP-CTERM system-associated)